MTRELSARIVYPTRQDACAQTRKRVDLLAMTNDVGAREQSVFFYDALFHMKNTSKCPTCEPIEKESKYVIFYDSVPQSPEIKERFNKLPAWIEYGDMYCENKPCRYPSQLHVRFCNKDHFWLPCWDYTVTRDKMKEELKSYSFPVLNPEREIATCIFKNMNVGCIHYCGGKQNVDILLDFPTAWNNSFENDTWPWLKLPWQLLLGQVVYQRCILNYYEHMQEMIQHQLPIIQNVVADTENRMHVEAKRSKRNNKKARGAPLRETHCKKLVLNSSYTRLSWKPSVVNIQSL